MSTHSRTTSINIIEVMRLSKPVTEPRIKLSLYEFLDSFLKALPGKELGQNILEFNRFLYDVGLKKVVLLDGKGEVSVLYAELRSLNLPKIVEQILTYLGKQMESFIADSYARLFVDVYEEIKSDSVDAADTWFAQMLSKHKDLLVRYGILDIMPNDIWIPGIFSVLKPAQIYIFEKRTDRGLLLFKEAADSGIPGLYVTKLSPLEVQKQLKLKPCISVVWIKFDERTSEAIAPDELTRLLKIISDFVSESQRSVVLLDPFYELKLVNGFEKAFDFLRELKEVMVSSKSSLIITIDSAAFTPEQFAAIERELKGAKT